MALNDVNVLAVTDEVILYEYAFLRDGRKIWAKAIHNRSSSLMPTEELVAIIRDAESVREVVDHAEA